MDSIFKALNDSTRRGILELLRPEDMSAGQIGEHFHISGPSISHHLDLLKQADLVRSSKNGQYVYYSLNQNAMDDLVKWLLTFKPKKRSKGLT